MTFVPLEAQNLSRSRFSCMVIPFSMCLLDSDEGKVKVKYSPLYGRGSEVTILVGRHFQSGMLPFERASKNIWLGHIFFKIGDLTKSALFGGPTLPPPPPSQGQFYGYNTTGGTKPIPKYVFLYADSILNVFTSVPATDHNSSCHRLKWVCVR